MSSSSSTTSSDHSSGHNRRRGQHKKKNNNDTPRTAHDLLRGTTSSRDYSDKQIEKKILPLVSIDEEWRLPWDVDALPWELPGEINNWFVLRNVALYLPLRMRDLLAFRSVCVAYAAIADRLPHVRYLLPLRVETPHILTHLGAVWLRSGADRVSVSDLQRGRLFGPKSSDDGSKCCAMGTCHMCCGQPMDDSSDCCMCRACDVSSCSCSSSADEEEVQHVLSRKRAVFLEAASQRDQLQPNEKEAALAEIAIPRRQRAISWARMLRDRVRGGRPRDDALLSPHNLDGAAAAAAAAVAAVAAPPQPRRLPVRGNNNNSNRRRNDARHPQQSRRQRRHYDDDDTETDTDFDTDTDDSDSGGMYAHNISSTDFVGSTSMSSFVGAGGAGAAAPPAAAAAAADDGHDDDTGDEGGDEAGDGLDTQDSIGGGMMPDDPQSTYDPDFSIGVRIAVVTIRDIPIKNRPRGLVVGSHPTPLRVEHKTLLSNAELLMRGVSYRRDLMYLSISDFADSVRKTLSQYQQHVPTEGRELCERTPRALWCVVVFQMVQFALLFMMGVLLGNYVFDTVLDPSDNAMARNVACMVLAVLLVTLGCCTGFVEDTLEDQDRRASANKAWTVLLWTMALSVFSPVASLLYTRVATAQALLDAGTASVCDMAVAPTGEASRQRLSTVYSTSQCHLPFSVLPPIAHRAFLQFPKGTKLLYNPADAKEIVANYAAHSSNSTTNDCLVAGSQPVEWNNSLVFNQSKTLITRGAFSVYTVIYPSSFCGSGGVKNQSLVILGDEHACPFWTYGSSLSSRFAPVLQSSSAADAVAEANKISPSLGQHVSASNTETFQPACGRAANAMVEVTGDFSLRIADTYSPHWSSNFFTRRLPLGQSKSERKLPWALRPDWVRTYLYQLYGILAVVADSDMLLARTADPPQIASLNPDMLDTPFGSSARIWSGATIAGIEALRDDWQNYGTIFVAVVCGTYVLGIIVVVKSWGASRIAAWITALLFLMTHTLPVALLIYSAICFHFTHPHTDFRELSQPAFCLMTSREDALGPLIWSSILTGIWFVILCVTGTCACCGVTDCDEGCSKAESCCSGCCEVLCRCCPSSSCCSCCSCCSNSCCSCSCPSCCSACCDCCGAFCDKAESCCSSCCSRFERLCDSD